MVEILGKIIVGLGLVIAASKQIVASTEFFADYFQWSPFVVSLLVVSIGTNIPELALVIRSVVSRHKDVAFADYLGSAAANTVLFGILCLIYGSTIVLPNHFIQRFIFLFVGLILFYVFTKSKNVLSRKEGLILMFLYAGFIAVELLIENQIITE